MSKPTLHPSCSVDRSRFPARGVFIAGTDTGVGKTYVGEALARTFVRHGHRVGVYKPVASGTDEPGPTDFERLWIAAGQPATLPETCPQAFGAPLAPHLAAKAENAAVDQQLLIDGLAQWKDQCDFVLVEGVGGLMSPITEELFCADLAEIFGYPLIVTVPNRLGCINATLQTLVTAATFRDGLPVHGVVLNDHCSPAAESTDESVASNLEQIRKHCVPPVLAHLIYGQTHFGDVVEAESLWSILDGQQTAPEQVSDSAN